MTCQYAIHHLGQNNFPFSTKKNLVDFKQPHTVMLISKGNTAILMPMLYSQRLSSYNPGWESLLEIACGTWGLPYWWKSDDVVGWACWISLEFSRLVLGSGWGDWSQLASYWVRLKLPIHTLHRNEYQMGCISLCRISDSLYSLSAVALDRVD